MELRHLRYFTAVAQTGSLTDAARRVHVSQPAISYQVKQMESELGVPLLKRHPRGVTITKAGEVLLERCMAVLQQVDELDRAMSLFGSAKPRVVTFGMSPMPAKALAVDLMQVCSAGDRYRIEIREHFGFDLYTLVSNGELDCALCFSPAGTDLAVKVISLADEDLYAVAATGTFGPSEDGTLAFSEVAKLPLVLGSHGRAVRDIADRLGINIHVTDASSVNVRRELIRHHGLCSMVPYGLFEEEVNAGGLEVRRIVEPAITRTLSLIFHKSREEMLTPLFEQVGRLVRENKQRSRKRLGELKEPAEPDVQASP